MSPTILLLHFLLRSKKQKLVEKVGVLKAGKGQCVEGKGRLTRAKYVGRLCTRLITLLKLKAII